METQYIRKKQKSRRRKKRLKRMRAFLIFVLFIAVITYCINYLLNDNKYIYLDTGDTTYYSQTDERWGKTLYGTSGTIGEGGCGPSCLAMVVSTFAETDLTPLDTSNWAAASGLRSENSGSFHNIIVEGGKHYNFNVTGIDLGSKEKITNALNDNKLIVALMGKGHFTTSGHFILLRGVTDDGKILVSDPMSRKRSAKKWDIDIILKEAKRGAAAGGPFWICEK